MTDFNKPVVGDRYDTLILPEIKDRDVSAAKMDFSADSNVPTNAVSFTLWNKTSHAGRNISREIRLETPGTITMLATTRVPDGWLLCNGATLTQTDYADLYAEIGTTFGAAGTGTFKLPDMRQKFPMGKSASGVGNVLGTPGGTIDHTHTGATHQHAYSHAHTVTRHYHGFSTGSSMSAAGMSYSGRVAVTGYIGVDNTGYSDGSHGHGISGDGSHAHSQYVTANDSGYVGTWAFRRDYNSDGESASLPTGSNTYASSANISLNTESSHVHGYNLLLGNISHVHSQSNVYGTVGIISSVRDGNSDQYTGTQSATDTVFDGGGAGTAGATAAAVNPPFQPLLFIIKT